MCQMPPENHRFTWKSRRWDILCMNFIWDEQNIGRDTHKKKSAAYVHIENHAFIFETNGQVPCHLKNTYVTWQWKNILPSYFWYMPIVRYSPEKGLCCTVYTAGRNESLCVMYRMMNEYSGWFITRPKNKISKYIDSICLMQNKIVLLFVVYMLLMNCMHWATRLNTERRNKLIPG